jgi:hypothetical protein
MPDITMCHGFECPVKEKCKRFNVKPDKHWQAYFLSPPYEKTDNSFKCNFYWGDQAEAIWKDLENIMGIETSD